ncbi:MAG: hypothetical protein RJA70_3266 [Pseudomonadota bacterium]
MSVRQQPWHLRCASYLRAGPRRQSLVLAALIYALCTGVYFIFADADVLGAHTPYNHFAHLAHGWLQGDLHLADGPPAYAHNNDFALYRDRWFVAFPPFPALLLLPFVAIAGSPEGVFDGRVFLWLAGLGPALLFLALDRLKSCGLSERTDVQNITLTLCFAFGSVYFFSAEQGTVWFAAHVVGVACGAAYLLCAIGARFPLLAGLFIGLGSLTRAPLIFAVPFFALEALRTAGAQAASGQGIVANLRAVLGSVRIRPLLLNYAWFSLPILVCLGFTFWHNNARFDDPFESGYQHLTVAWQARMQKWGLFDYHYLARNLGVFLTSLPWSSTTTPFRVNAHGLAIWFTTPLYLWLMWPKRRGWLHLALWLTVLLVAVPTLFYQNSGWAQFGYRFSNDYAVFLFALLAVGARPMRGLFFAAATWALLVNAFGAWTFGRSAYKDYYYFQGAQKVLYEPD